MIIQHLTMQDLKADYKRMQKWADNALAVVDIMAEVLK